MTTQPAPRLSPAPPALVDRLQLARDAIHAEVLAAYFDSHPPASDADRVYVTRRCREDLASHLDQLVAALLLRDADVLAAYLRWLRDVLAHRCMAVAHTADALQVVHDWVRANIDLPEVREVLALLKYGIAVLGEAGSATQLILPPPTQPVQSMTQALVTGRRDGVEQQVLAAMSEGAALVDVAVDLLQPALYHVGALWQQNRISVAQEHLATAIVQSAMAAGFAAAEPAAPVDRSAAFACVEGNLHTVGLRMVSDAFEVAGWNVSFFGANTPTLALLAHCGEQRPDLLGLSVSQPPQVPVLRELIGLLRAEMGNAAPAVLVGGLTVNQLGAAARGLGADAWVTDARAAVQVASG